MNGFYYSGEMGELFVMDCAKGILLAKCCVVRIGEEPRRLETRWV